MIVPKYDYELARSPISPGQLRRMPGYNDMRVVESCPRDISADEFERRFWRPGRPVVIREGIAHWRAFDAWRQTSYVRKCAGSQTIEITKGLLLDFMLMKITERLSGPRLTAAKRDFFGTMLVNEYLDACDRGAERILYARNVPLPPSLNADTGNLHYFSGPILKRSVFFGRQSFTDSHEHGGVDSFACVIRGSREFILHPPDGLNTKALYSSYWLKNWSPVRFFDVDLAKFPRFVDGTPLVARLKAGDVLYIPNPYWHAVISGDEDLTINVSCWVPTRRLRYKHPPTRRAVVSKVLYFATSLARRIDRGRAGHRRSAPP